MDKIRFRPYGGVGKLPVDCCEFSVVDEMAGKEVCRCWSLEDAQRIAFLLDVNFSDQGAGGRDAPINWANDPDAFVEDDEPQIGRDYA